MIDRAHINGYSYQKEKDSRESLFASLAKASDLFNGEMVQASAFALIFGMASINGLYPFGLSFMAACALSKKRFIIPGLFSLMGILIAIQIHGALRYLLAMIFFSLGFAIFKNRIYKSALLAGTFIFLSNTVAGLIYLSAKGLSPYDILLLGMESVLTSVMAFILIGGMPWVFKMPSQGTEKNICLAILTGVVLSIAKKYVIFGISVRDVLGVFSVLMMALVNGPGAGASTGVIIGIMGYASSLSPWLMGVLAISGLISGAFNKLGKAGVIIGFSLGVLLYNLYVNSLGEVIISWYVLLLSFGILLVIPNAIIQRIVLYLNYPSRKKTEGKRELLEDRLCEVASFLEDLGSTFIRLPLVTDSDNSSTEYLEKVCKEAQRSVCSSCGMKRVCWEKEFKRTVGSFYKFIKNYNGYSSNNDIPYLFKSRCNKTEEIVNIIKGQWEIYDLNRQINEVVKSNQQLIHHQYQKAAEIVKTMAYDIYEELDDHNIFDDKIRDKLNQMEIYPERVYTDEDPLKCQINIIKPPCKGDHHCETLIPKAIKDVLGRKTSVRIIECPLKSGSQKCRLKVSCEGVLGVSVGVTGVAKEGNDISGDGFSFSELRDGKYLLALCDGMGVGQRAFQHSEKTITLIERLLETGFNREASIKIVNSAMLAFNNDEGFSTADLVLIDTHSGKSEFIKAGAPEAYIKRGSKVEVIKGGSFPIGIMDVFSPKFTERYLKPQDMIILVTDGIVDAFSSLGNGEESLKKFISNIKTANPQKMADEILNRAKRQGEIKDDMTVLVAHLWEKNPYALCFFNDFTA